MNWMLGRNTRMPNPACKQAMKRRAYFCTPFLSIALLDTFVSYTREKKKKQAFAAFILKSNTITFYSPSAVTLRGSE